MLQKIFTTVKYTLLTINFIFVITGIIVLSVGSSVQSAYNAYHAFLSERFFSLPAFCIATGIIIFLIAAVGFYGAFMENHLVITSFVVAMVLIFIFQVSACIAGYALKGNTLALIQHEMSLTMDLYGNGTNQSPEITQLWDIVQQEFRCCGSVNATEWIGHIAVKQIPLSCCQIPPGQVHQFTCDTNQTFVNGCGQVFGSWVQGHAGSIGVAGVFLVLFQAVVVAGALWMVKMIREDSVSF